MRRFLNWKPTVPFTGCFCFCWITPLPSLQKRFLISGNIWASSQTWMWELPSGHGTELHALSLQHNFRLAQCFSVGETLPKCPHPPHCLCLTAMAVSSLKPVLVSFPFPPTNNLIYVCVSLHIISFRETNSARLSVWITHCIHVQTRSVYILPSSLAGPCLLLCRVGGQHRHAVCLPRTICSALLWSSVCSHLGGDQVFWDSSGRESPRCLFLPFWCWIMQFSELQGENLAGCGFYRGCLW